MNRNAILEAIGIAINTHVSTSEFVERTYPGAVFDRPEFDGLRTLLGAQPEFQGAEGFFIGSNAKTRFTPELAARPLCLVAQQRGEEAAMNWLEKVLSTTRSTVIFIAEVWGITAPKGGIKSENITFTPWGEQPVTAAAQYHSDFARRSDWPMGMPPAAVAILEIPNALVGTTEFRLTEIHTDVQQDPLGKIETHILSMTGMFEYGTYLGRSWFDFADPDLQIVPTGFGWCPSFDLPFLVLGSTEISSEIIAFGHKCLELEGDKLKRRVDRANRRLNRARRHRDLADSAVDLAIALEALVGEDRFDISYKLKLRCALLAGADQAERRSIMKDIGKLYDLRSKIVHGSSDVAKPEDRALVDRALKICATALQRLINHGRLPDWANFELSGGENL